jgi:glycosyltransferase involved in cell wall biosynthesis
MRWLYPANVRIPSEKAHVYQIFQMVDALQRAGVEVQVAYPARANLRDLERQDPVALYGLRTRPHLIELPTLDLVRLVTIDVPALNRRPLPQLAFGLQSLTFALNAARFAQRVTKQRPGRPDVLYGRDWPVLAACVRFAPDLPAFWESHDLPQGAAARAALRRLLPRLAGVVAISRGLRDALVDLGVPAGKVLVAPDAVDLRRFSRSPRRDAARQSLRLPPEAKIVVYAGHLYAWKGAHTLALASRHLPHDTLVCIVGGTPADLAAFRAFVAEQRLERVRLAGHVPPGEVPTWLAAANALALPNSARETISTRYTSPLKLFEYMAARRPIVASDLPSLREVLTHDRNALLVPPDDPAPLAAGISAILNDHARGQRLARAAWCDVQDRTWEARARAIVSFVQSLSG